MRDGKDKKKKTYIDRIKPIIRSPGKYAQTVPKATKIFRFSSVLTFLDPNMVS